MERFWTKTVMMFAAVAALASCRQDPVIPPVPQFPEAVDKNFEPGEAVNFSFNANLDWELSISGEGARWFYFDDGGIKAQAVKGQAGVNSVCIKAVEVVDNYAVRSCNVEMTMGGDRRSVYHMNLMPAQRAVAVFEALKDENGSYTLFDGGDYQYSTEASTGLRMTWPAEVVSYMLPVKVVSNFDWGMAVDYPAWLVPSITNSSDSSVSVMFKGNAHFYPEEDQSGKLRFLDVNSGECVYEIPVSIDGCKDVARVKCDDDVIGFNKLGQYNQNGQWVSEGCAVSLTSMKGSAIVAFELRDGHLAYNPDGWVRIADNSGSADPKAVISERTCVISTLQNSDPDRKAVLVALPAHIVKAGNLEERLLNADRTAIKPEFEKYHFADVSQAGVDPTKPWGVLSPLNSDYTMALQGGAIEPTPESDPDFVTLSARYGTEEIYTVSYNNQFSYEKVIVVSDKEFDSVAYLDMSTMTESDESLYLELAYPEDGMPNVFRLDVMIFDETVPVAVVLRKGDEVVAALKCVMSEKFWPVTDYRDIYFSILDSISPEDEEFMPKGVLLEELTSGEVYEKYAPYGIPVWHLAYDSPSSKYNAMINVPPYPADNVNSIGIDDSVRGWLSAEGGLTDSDKAYLHVSMSDKAPESGNSSVIVLYGGERPLFALLCERRFN